MSTPLEDWNDIEDATGFEIHFSACIDDVILCFAGSGYLSSTDSSFTIALAFLRVEFERPEKLSLFKEIGVRHPEIDETGIPVALSWMSENGLRTPKIGGKGFISTGTGSSGGAKQADFC